MSVDTRSTDSRSSKIPLHLLGSDRSSFSLSSVDLHVPVQHIINQPVHVHVVLSFEVSRKYRYPYDHDPLIIIALFSVTSI